MLPADHKLASTACDVHRDAFGRWKQVYDLLVAFSFAARIPHKIIIVIPCADVKLAYFSGTMSTRFCSSSTARNESSGVRSGRHCWPRPEVDSRGALDLPSFRRHRQNA